MIIEGVTLDMMLRAKEDVLAPRRKKMDDLYKKIMSYLESRIEKK